MATNFPTTLDTLTNPTGTDKVSVVDHAAQHANVNDAVEALEAKVGVDGSAVTTSHDYKLSGITSTAKAVSNQGNETIAGNKTFSGTLITTSPQLTTPQITTSINDSNGNEIITTPATASAVNHVKITNAITTADPLIEADGSDTDVGLRLKGKGTGKVKIGDAEIAFPDADGSNGQVLQTDGSGNLSFVGASSNKLEVDTTEVTVSTTTTETTLFDYSVPGGTLSTNNAVRFKLWISSITNEDTWTFRFKYGSTTVASMTLASTSNMPAQFGFIEGELVADGSTSAQKGVFRFMVHTANGDYNGATASTASEVMRGIDFGTATEDSTGNLTLSVTAQNSAANPSALTAEWWIVEKVA